MKCLVKDLTFHVRGTHDVSDTVVTRLCHRLPGENGPVLAEILTVEADNKLHSFHGPSLVYLETNELADLAGALEVFFLIGGEWETWAMFGLCKGTFVYGNLTLALSAHSADSWVPAIAPDNTLRRPALSWLSKGPNCLEMAGVDAEGHLHALEVIFVEGSAPTASTKVLSNRPPFLAATVMHPGLIAGVTIDGVCRLRRGAGGLETIGVTRVTLAAAVAGFHSERGRELIVVCASGTVVRVPAPV